MNGKVAKNVLWEFGFNCFFNSSIRSCSHLVPCVLLPLTINASLTPRVQGEHQFACPRTPSTPAGSTIPLDTDSWLVYVYVLTSYPSKAPLKEFW